MKDNDASGPANGRSAGWNAAIWIVGLAAAWPFAGCARPRPAGSDAFGIAAPDHDPAKAWLTLDRIKPDPAAPKSAEGELPELSAESVRRVSRADQLYREQRFTEASLELEKAIRQDSNHPVLHRDLAKTLFAAGNAERARANLNRAAELNPDDVVTHYLQGRIAVEDGRNDEAVRLLRTALKTSNLANEPSFKALTHFYLARALNAEGYLTAAIEQYRAFERAAALTAADESRDPQLTSLVQINGGRAGAAISVAYEKLGRYGEAADALAAALADRQADADSRDRLARLLARSGRVEQALTEARSLFDEPDRAVKLLVAIHEQSGQAERAVDDVRDMLERNPDRADVRLVYVDVLSRFDRDDEAASVLRDAMQRNPADASLRWRLFDVERKRRQWMSAFATAADALRSDGEAYETARARIQEMADEPGVGAIVLSAAGEVERGKPNFATDYLLGIVASRVRRVDLAEEYFRMAAAAQPLFLPAQIETARILLDRYDWQGAVDLMSADAERLREDGRMSRLVGTAYAGLDDVKNAEIHLENAVRLNRSDTEAMAALADLLRRQGQFLRAERQYRTIVEINPLDESAREALFELYLFSLEKTGDAAAELAELRRLSASPHRIARCTARLEIGAEGRQRDWSRYRRTLTDEIERSGPDARTVVLVANSHLQEDNAAQALSLVEQAVTLDPREPDHLLARAMIQRDLLDYEGAAETMRALLNWHPNRTIWIQRLLGILLIDHRFAEAHELAAGQLARAELSDDEIETYRETAVEALRRLKRFDEQIALVRKWHDASPDDPKLLGMLIRAHWSAERFDDAIALARSRHERESDDTARRELLDMLIDAKRYVAAQQFLLRELDDDPESADLHAGLIRVLATSDRHEDALELIENLKFIFRTEEARREATIAVLQGAKRFDEAISYRKKWLRELKGRTPDPDDGKVEDMQFRLANTLIVADRIEEAVASLRRWIDEAESPGVRFAYLTRLSLCHQFRDERAKSIDALKQAFEMKDQVLRQDAGIHNDLGYSLADAGVRVDEAERMIRFALVRQPDNGAYLDSYGWVLYKKGEFEKARRWLVKAVDTDEGKDPVVHDHLGDALWRLGKTSDAAELWAKAVALAEEEIKEANRLDLRRLLESASAKLEAHRSKGTPSVAPTAQDAPP